MASIEAISLGAMSVNNLTVSKGNAVSDKGGQFEGFLKNNNAKKDAPVNPVGETKTQDSAYVKDNSYAKPERLQGTQQTDSSQVPSKASEQELEAVKEELNAEIRQIVKDNLGLDDETLDAALLSMGIVLADLLNPEVLQQFVLFVGGGEESTDFLTNETLMQSFNNLLQALEDFKADNQDVLLPLMEQLDTPITLEEFLKQEGPVDTETFATQLDAVQTDKTAGEQENVVVSKGNDTKVEDVADEKSVVIKENPSEVTVKVTDSQESTAGEETFGQKDDDMLFAEKDFSADERTVTTPLFAENLNTVVEDGVRFLRSDIGATQRMQQMIDIVNQVSESIRSTVSEGTTSVEMQLNPESLGKVLLTVTSKDGIMTANFQVQSEEARHALESQILILRDNLEAKNLKVESVEVHVSDFSFAQSNQAEAQNQQEFVKQGKRKFRYDTEDSEEQEAVDEVNAEVVRRQVMRDTGGSIDFTA